MFRFRSFQRRKTPVKCRKKSTKISQAETQIVKDFSSIEIKVVRSLAWLQSVSNKVKSAPQAFKRFKAN